MHLDKTAIVFDGVPDFCSGAVVRCNGRANGDAAILGNLTGHKADAPYISISVLFGKTKLAREISTYNIAVQQCDRSIAHFQKTRIEHFGNGRFSRT